MNTAATRVPPTVGVTVITPVSAAHYPPPFPALLYCCSRSRSHSQQVYHVARVLFEGIRVLATALCAVPVAAFAFKYKYVRGFWAAGRQITF